MDKPTDSPAAWLRTETRKGIFRLIAGGDWVTPQAATLDASLRGLDTSAVRQAEIDGSEITRLDSAGAWLLLRAKREF